MPGRPPIPFATHEARGTKRSYVKKREAEALSVATGPVGDPPEWISPEGREEWARIIGNEDYVRALTPVDRGAMIDYCNLYGVMVRASRRLPAWIDGAPASIPDAEGVIEREKLGASERQTLHSLRMQLGLTPASRPKVKAPAAKAGDDEWARFDKKKA